VPTPQPGVVPSRRRNTVLNTWVGIVGFCLAVLVATYLMFVEPPPPRRIVIASGGRSGAYYLFATKYAEELRKAGLTVEVLETAGSVENLQLLGEERSGVAVAIVQSGVASPGEIQRFLALGSLYREPLWVFYRGDERLERLSQLEGKKIGVGQEGSGTFAVAKRMLTVNGLIEPEGSGNGAKVRLVQEDVAGAASALQKGEIDAAFFVAAFEAGYVQQLLNNPQVKLLDFGQHEAYRRRFRFLAPVKLPAGMVDLGRNVPRQDVDLLAPTAMLVVRKDFHPALIPLLLGSAKRIHRGGDELNEPGEFPSASYCDFPVSDDATRFYRSGEPVLQRLLPFWLASLADRAKVMLIPLVMLMMPLLRAAPPLMRWRARRKIYRWYSALREIDQRLAAGLAGPELNRDLARLKQIAHKLTDLNVPLGYMKECYQLKQHINMLQEQLVELGRAATGRDESPVTSQG
jgi:TRAP transporter TAXI family solute receptor